MVILTISPSLFQWPPKSKLMDTIPFFAKALAMAGTGVIFLLENITCMSITIGHSCVSCSKISYLCIVMAKKTDKTNAARLLDKADLKYNLIPYEFDENDLAAQHVADSLGQDIAKVFKTLVLHGDKTGHLVCVIPGNCEVDLKALAKVSANKKVEMIAMKDLLGVTGYIRGGCSPIGMKKHFPTYFHRTARDFDTIYVSAGVRGLQIEINPEDLIRFVRATVADIAVPSGC